MKTITPSVGRPPHAVPRVRSLIYSLILPLALLACTSTRQYTRPIVRGAPSIEARDLWDLDKGQPIGITVKTGGTIVGKYQGVVGKGESDDVRYIRYTKRIPDSMLIDPLAVHLKNPNGSHFIRIGDIKTIARLTHTVPCRQGGLGCSTARYWSRLNSDYSTWCRILSVEEADTLGEGGFFVGVQYWLPEVVEEVNSLGAQTKAYVSLVDGSEHRAESLRVGPDSTSWQSGSDTALTSVATSELQSVRFVKRAGLARGLEASSEALEFIYEGVDECSGLGCIVVLIAAPVALIGGAASAVSAGNEITFEYRSEPICADSPGIQRFRRAQLSRR